MEPLRVSCACSRDAGVDGRTTARAVRPVHRRRARALPPGAHRQRRGLDRLLRRAVRSDEAGIFSLGDVPAGVYRVQVRAVGRQPFVETIAVGTSGRIERAFLLAPARNELERVTVTADGNLDAMRLAGFNERRELGLGRFLVEDELDAATGRRLSDVLTSRMPGVQIVRGPGSSESYLASKRGYQRVEGGGPCLVRVYVDGMLRYNGQGRFNIDEFDPSQLSGIEFYTVSQTPPQFNPTGVNCGTIVIWTRWRLP